MTSTLGGTMRTNRLLLTLVGAGALALAACGGGNYDDTFGAAATTEAAATGATTVAPAATTTAVSEGGGYGGGYAVPPTTPTTAAAGGQASVAVGQVDGADVLVDSGGFTLYLFTKDSGSTSSCTDACAEAWPPAVATGTPTPGAGLDAAQITTITRADGATQLAYAGHPLYRFALDTGPGQSNGQGSGGVWFMVGADGAAIND
jgi:predicted lipoprotein with Yx(FWY)xxD motif